MTITHQTVVNEDGVPTAAIIPWDQFEALREQASENTISEEWRVEIAGRAEEIDQGKVDLVDGQDFISRLNTV